MTVRVAWIVIAVLLAAAPARAQPAVDPETYAKAQEYFQAGKRAFDAEQYVVAIAAFEEAYKLTPKPAAAYALASAYRNQWAKDADAAKLKRAVTLFREVLAQPDDAKKPKWAKTRDYLDVLEPALAEVEAKQAAEGGGPVAEAAAVTRTALILSSKVKGTRLRFDDEPEVAAPIVKETTPGVHRVAAYADGYYTTTQEVIAIEGQSLPVDLILEERPASVTVRSDDGARVVVDGLVAGSANQELSIPAGVHRIEVIASGRHVWVQQLHLAKGETLELEAPLSRTRKRRAVKWVAAAAVALAIGGGGAAAAALEAQGDAEAFEDARDDGVMLTPEEREAHDDAIDRRDAWRTGAAWLFGGAAAGALGVLYLFFSDVTPAVSEAPVIAAVPGGATASWGWTF